MTAIATESRTAFRALVYEDPRFVEFFRSATPIDVIERMPIGSRPSSRRAGGGRILLEMLHGWPFFTCLIDDAEMVLAKSDLDVVARYATLTPRALADRHQRIADEHRRTCAAILEARGTTQLLSADPTLARSIGLRNPYVDPMSLLQVELLARWRGAGSADDATLEALRATVRGIALGLQNTG